MRANTMRNAAIHGPGFLPCLMLSLHLGGQAQAQTLQRGQIETDALAESVVTASVTQTTESQNDLFGAISTLQASGNLQVGVDAWQLRPSIQKDRVSNQNGNTNLFLANSGTAWPYSDQSPWLTFQGTVRPLSDTVLSFRYRADQALGSQLDELSIDQAYYAFGARVGVLDYKTTWCRAYDLDAPWVRENDPICTVDQVGRYLRAAPGVQFYSNFVLGGFKWQAAVGSYSPLWLDYDKREFTNTYLSNLSTVTQNEKLGASVNAMHLDTGLELRLGFLRTNQSAETREFGIGVPTYRINQHVEVAYAGISFYPVPLLNLRLTHTDTTDDVTYLYPPGYVRPDDTVPETFLRQSDPNKASILELNYQASSRDVVSYAYSVNELGTLTNSYLKKMPSGTVYMTQSSNNFQAKTVNMSLSWRRDWGRNVFTVLQWSTAEFKGSKIYLTGDPPVYAESTGTAIGLRLGYKL